MTASHALDWLSRMLHAASMIGGPLVAAAVAVGFTVAVFQAATQINDSALGFVPKLLALGGALAVGGEWMLLRLVEFAQMVFQAIANPHGL